VVVVAVKVVVHAVVEPRFVRTLAAGPTADPSMPRQVSVANAVAIDVVEFGAVREAGRSGCGPGSIGRGYRQNHTACRDQDGDSRHEHLLHDSPLGMNEAVTVVT